MMAHSSLTLFGIFLLFMISYNVHAQNSPSPSSAPALNITEILLNGTGGQLSVFVRLIVETQVDSNINNQLRSSSDGVTVFAPTDNGFNSLEAGFLNDLSTQEKVNLLLNHVLPKYYERLDLLSVSNPVRTQYSEGGLNFTGQNNQVNVSSGLIVTQVNNPLRQERPLAIYLVDKVLIPAKLSVATSPVSAPPPAKTTSSDTNNTKAAAPSDNDSAGYSTTINIGLAFILGVLGLAMNLS